MSSGTSYPSPRYAWYVVGVLTLVYVFSFIDRQILNLLVRPIKSDLGISDSQMSYLMGFSFALFYAVFGIPFGRLADTWSRRSLIAVGFVFWSIATTGCGLARFYWQLLLMRVGVGVGEAALSPAAYSLIADYFPKEKRATALGVYAMGIYLGSGLSFMIGGYLTGIALTQDPTTLPLVGAIRPWQMVFFYVGLPGILLALLMYTVREPERRDVRMAKTADGTVKATTVPLREVLSYIGANRWTFVCHNVGFALLSFSSYGTAAWIPSFLQRSHGWSVTKAGLVYGGVVAVFSTLGAVSGGWVADWLAKRGYRDATMRVGLFVSIAWFPTGMLYPVMGDPWLAVVLLAPTLFLASAPFGVAPAAIQQIMPGPMRGQGSAIYLFVVNLIGMGLGPSAVAWTTDYVFLRDESKTNQSLLIVTTGAHVVASLLLWWGMKPFLRSLDRVQEWTGRSSEPRA